MSHVLFAQWLTSDLLKTTHCFLRCYFYLFTHLITQPGAVYGIGLWVHFYVLDARSDLLEPVS